MFENENVVFAQFFKNLKVFCFQDKILISFLNFTILMLKINKISEKNQPNNEINLLKWQNNKDKNKSKNFKFPISILLIRLQNLSQKNIMKALNNSI